VLARRDQLLSWDKSLYAMDMQDGSGSYYLKKAARLTPARKHRAANVGTGDNKQLREICRSKMLD